MRKESLILARLKKVWTVIHHTAVFLNLLWQSLLKVRVWFHQMLSANISTWCHRRTVSVGWTGWPGGSPEGFTTIIGRGGSHRGPRAARHHPHTSHKPFSPLSHLRLLTCCGWRGDTDLPKWVQSSKGAAPTWGMSLLSRQHYQGTTHSGNSLWQEDIRAHPSQQLRQQHPGKQYTPPNFIQEKSTLQGFFLWCSRRCI